MDDLVLARRCRGGRLKGNGEQLVVGRALLGIRQDVIGAYELPEPQCSVRIVGIDVGWVAFAALRNAVRKPSASSLGSAPSKSYSVPMVVLATISPSEIPRRGASD